MSAKDEKPVKLLGEIAAGVHEFLLALLKRLCYVVHILFLDLPRFIRRLRGKKKEIPITFCRLSGKAITFHEACRLVEELNLREGFRVEKPPILCEELCQILYEDLSHKWRLPTHQEILTLSKEIADDAASAKLPAHPSLFAVWTLGEDDSRAALAEIRNMRRYAYAVRTLAPEEHQQ